MHQLMRRFAARPFGSEQGDLSVDFQRRNRALITTEVLTLSLSLSGDELSRSEASRSEMKERVRGLPMGDRILLLLRVASLEAPDATLELQLTCANGSCRHPLEIPLAFSELEEFHAHGKEAALIVSHGGSEYALRLPTGADQERWTALAAQGLSAQSREAIQAAMVRDLVEGVDSADALGSELVGRLSSALALADPLAAFEVTSECPHCGEERTYEFDLERFALGLLEARQAELLSQVHRLASHFHWSEREIFEVPHWRRRMYLARIEQTRSWS